MLDPADFAEWDEGKVFWGKRFDLKPRIHIGPWEVSQIDCGTRASGTSSISAGRLQIGFRTQGAK